MVPLLQKITSMLVAASILFSCSTLDHSSKNIKSEVFGQNLHGKDVTLYTLTNKSGLEAKFMNYGAILVSLKVPDRNGQLENINLGFDELEPYLTRNPFYGATVGRYANRIAFGKLTLDGKTYQLTTNNGRHHLHGGKEGFDNAMWHAEPFENAAGVGIRFSYLSIDGEEGYPGNLNTRVIFTLTHDNQLNIDYHATTDKTTVVNLTNHSCFNLRGAENGDVMDHQLVINADNYTPGDEELIPTGDIAPVAGTPLDFRDVHTIGERVKDIPRLGFYDHNYVLNKPDASTQNQSNPKKSAFTKSEFNETSDPMIWAARIKAPTSGRIMEIFTTEPGLQFNTGRVNSFCLETQHYPDSPNKPNFPSTILRPGETYQSSTTLKFYTD